MNARSLGLAVTLVAVAHAQGPALAVSTPVTTIEFGRAFDLLVERSWPSGFEPEPWRDDLLAPLMLQVRWVDRREADGRILEASRCRARVFELGDVAVPPPTFRARPVDGGASLTATDGGLRFAVTSSLPEGDPGSAELPEVLFPAPFPWRRSGLGAMAALALLGLSAWWFARRRAARVPVPGESPAERAHSRLRALRDAGPDCDARAFHLAGSSVLREFVSEQFAVATRERTTDESLAAAADVMTPTRLGTLRSLLTECDATKFALSQPDFDRRMAWLAGAEQFVREAGSR